MPTKDPMNGQRVAVTGAGGFIGSHLVEALVASAAEVRALVRYNSMGRRGWLDESPAAAAVDIRAGDVRDADFVDRLLDGVDIVFHLAALIGIPYSYEAPRQYVETNIGGTLNVLQAARRHDVRVVHTSTSEVYGTAQRVPIDETHPLQAQSPYSASKIAADKLVESYWSTFAHPVVTVRPFNTYGPRQSARAVIPTIVSQALVGGPIRLGNLSPTRDLNFVSDTAAGFIAVAVCDAALGEVVNLGTGQEISIGDLAELTLDVVGTEAELLRDPERVRPDGSEVERLCADAGKARRLAHWAPQVSLRDGLQRTVEWMRRRQTLFRHDEYMV